MKKILFSLLLFLGGQLLADDWGDFYYYYDNQGQTKLYWQINKWPKMKQNLSS